MKTRLSLTVALVLLFALLIIGASAGYYYKKKTDDAVLQRDLVNIIQASNLLRKIHQKELTEKEAQNALPYNFPLVKVLPDSIYFYYGSGYNGTIKLEYIDGIVVLSMPEQGGDDKSTGMYR